jgi:hypothetical protein
MGGIRMAKDRVFKTSDDAAGQCKVTLFAKSSEICIELTPVWAKGEAA